MNSFFTTYHAIIFMRFIKVPCLCLVAPIIFISVVICYPTTARGQDNMSPGTQTKGRILGSSFDKDDFHHLVNISLNLSLLKRIPKFLSSQDINSGRFGKGPWIPTDQNVIFPLAVAWWYKADDNRYYHNKKVLEAIIKGGNALIDEQDSRGRWELVKKDGSRWGYMSNPWIYFRWIRAYDLVKNAMPCRSREQWRYALLEGFKEIAENILPRASLHNIPVTQAVALYIAGKALNRPDWQEQAKKFIERVVSRQSAAGYWSEHAGPVVRYGYVYIDALGVYYALTHDEKVLLALRRAACFHNKFTYPDGSIVKTIDERSYYNRSVYLGGIGLIFTREGRSFLYNQYKISNKKYLYHYLAASILLYAKDVDNLSSDYFDDTDVDSRFIIADKGAAIQRNGSWFLVVSAYTASQSKSRWILDRQNFVSIYHKKVGLIVGGGNTKLQPLWSSFTVGDTDLLKYVNNEKPDFIPPEGLLHIPDRAGLLFEKNSVGVNLYYGEQQCSIRMKIIDDETMEIEYARTPPLQKSVKAHITLLPKPGHILLNQNGKKIVLGKNDIYWPAGTFGDWIAHDSVRYYLPEQASIKWPILPYNQYKKDGRADLKNGRIVIEIPFSGETKRYSIMIKVPAY